MADIVCKGCGTRFEVPDCATCGTATCPKCSFVNEISAPPLSEDGWLDQCVPFTGVGVDQTLGTDGLPDGIFVEDLVRSVVIFDDNTKDGLREVSKAEFRNMGKIAQIANVKFFEARVPDGLQVKDVNGKAWTREGWYNSISPITKKPRHTDGLAIWAAKKLRLIQTGGGVTAGGVQIGGHGVPAPAGTARPPVRRLGGAN
jgi:hypothetical protein